MVVASTGDDPVTSPEDADVEVPVTDTLTMALRGRPLPAIGRGCPICWRSRG